MNKVSIVLYFGWLCLVILTHPSQATVPETITIQGTLEAPGGGPLTGTYPYAVRIWDASVGGTLLANSLGTTTLSDSGRFSLELLLEDVFVPPEQAWYDLGIDTDKDGIEPAEYFPRRVRFHSVPFARQSANSDLLEGQPASAFLTAQTVGSSAWSLSGNNPSTGQFLGTTNNQRLVIKVNNLRVLALIPNTSSPNLLGGHGSNTIDASVEGGTIAGGGNVSAPNQVNGNYGTISGGKNNQALGQYSVVAGGQSNQAQSNLGTIGGGDTNIASSEADTISGGQGNMTGGTGGATIAGGAANQASAEFSVIGGGLKNKIFGGSGTIAGGQQNKVTDFCAAIGGGIFNEAIKTYSTIPGGYANQANGMTATVGGGDQNKAVGESATISGGSFNQVNGENAIICGGAFNQAEGSGTVIGGGDMNKAIAQLATIGGGIANRAAAYCALIAGGEMNVASGTYSAIGGGKQNTTYSTGAVIAGGFNNHASGDSSTISGGEHNVTEGSCSVIGGGMTNTANGGTVAGGVNNKAGNGASVAGGTGNISNGTLSTIPGGYLNEASGNYSFAAGCRAKAMGDGSFVWGDNNQQGIISWGLNEFVVRATGGFWFITQIDEYGTPTEGMLLPKGSSTWVPIGTHKATQDEASSSIVQKLQNENDSLIHRVEGLEARLAELEKLIASRPQP